MKAYPTIRRYWREAALVIVILFPWLALLPLGFLWLWQQSAAIWWFLGTSLLGVVAFVLRLSTAKTAKIEANVMAERASPASLKWGLREKGAWRHVEQLARETDPLTFETEPITKVLERTVDAVAEHFHPDSSRARWRISLPEGLLLSEQLSRDLRSVILKHVPLVERLPLADVFGAKEVYDGYGNVLKKVYSYTYSAGRLARVIVNPKGALLKEIAELLVGQVGGFLSLRVRAELTSLLIREVGKAAINLYSGRLRLADHEIQTAASVENIAAKKDLSGPVRILLAGQVHAGKSSLLNAMAEQVQRNVGAKQTRYGPAELMLKLVGRPEVVLIDTPGVGRKPAALRILIEQTTRADMILWVVSATQPAKAIDVDTLKDLKKKYESDADLRLPPILVVVTHIDELAPELEWTPPYDLLRADRPKARRIRETIDHVGDVLDITPERIVPVCVREIQTAYNLDLLWNLVVANLDEARFAKEDRILRDASGFSVAQILSQFATGGRWVANAVWRGGS